ncbi:ABC transporter permease [Streptomyces sp. NPDC003717]|uniref:ABC transporter permease n=1 Tax=Streptomyces sp. NPDC003717 TaxID=3154276 RepID=UPI0033A13421
MTTPHPAAGPLRDTLVVFAGSARFQLAFARTNPDFLLVLVRTPLTTLILLALSTHAGRPDLAAYAVLAPVLMTLWDMALLIASDVITKERSWGTLELLAATPARFAVVVLARVLTVTTVSLLSTVEAWLVARAVFGVTIGVAHPALFALTMTVSSLAMAGTATLMSALFVLAPHARFMTNTLSYPVYLLAGVFVPLSMLPAWVRPLSSVVFLSWSADLLRATLTAGPVAGAGRSLAVIAVLGLAGALAGSVAVTRVLRHARAAGTLSEV